MTCLPRRRCMSYPRVLLATGALILAAQTALAAGDFRINYDPSEWTLTNSNADGSVNTSGAPNSIVLTGGSNGSTVAGDTDWTITVTAGDVIDFDWGYSSTDT